MTLKHFIPGFAQSLETWSLAHRLCIAIFAALFTLTIGMHFGATLKMKNITIRRSVVEKLAARVQAASASVAALPALRQRVAAFNVGIGVGVGKNNNTNNTGSNNKDNNSNRGGNADDHALVDDSTLLQTFTAIATANHLRLDTFEPSQSTVEPYWRERRLQLLVVGAFADLVNFTAQLASLSYPVVPVAAQLSRNGQKRAQEEVAGALSLNLSLRIIGVNDYDHNQTSQTRHLQPNSLYEYFERSAAELPNPFEAEAQQTALMHISATASSSAWQLVGLLAQGRIHAALIQSPSGFALLQAGDTFDGKTIERIDSTSLSLSSNGHTHRLLLQEPTL